MMIKKILVLLFLPLAGFAQQDSLDRPNALVFEAGFGPAFWLKQDVDAGFHNAFSGSILFKGKLNDRCFLSAGIAGFSMAMYNANDTILIAGTSAVNPSAKYYAISSGASGASLPVKFLYQVKNKGKLRVGAQLVYNIFDRVQRQVQFREVTTVTHFNNQEFWSQGSVNTGAPANMALEIPVSYSLGSTDLLFTPFASYKSPKEKGYGNLMMVGARLGISFHFRKMEHGIPTPKKDTPKK